MRRLIKTGAASAIYWSGAASVLGKVSSAASTPLIIGYHRVVDDYATSAENCIAPMLIGVKTLEKHVDWIGQHYTFATLDEVLLSKDDRHAPDQHLAALTFDDGYADVYHNAFPLLKRKGIPFSVFVVSDLVGTDRPHLHDELYLLLNRAFLMWRSPRKHIRKILSDIDVAPGQLGGIDKLVSHPFIATRAVLHGLPQQKILKLVDLLKNYGEVSSNDTSQLRSVSWKMLKDMRKEGVVIGSHTRTHAFLTNESSRKIVEEVKQSKSAIEQQLGEDVRHFAYPDGRFNRAAIKAVADAGYRAAYITCRHTDVKHVDFTIPRRVLWEQSCMDVFRRPSPAIMSCQVNGVFDFADNCRMRHPTY